MTDKKKTEKLSDDEIDGVTGGSEVKRWNFENAWPNKAADGDRKLKADNPDSPQFGSTAGGSPNV